MSVRRCAFGAFAGLVCSAVLAAALGLSLNQTASLLAVVLPPGAVPSRARLGRWVRAAAEQAGPVLEALDTACVPRVRELCLDEVFCHRRPVLVGVEPHSMAWVRADGAAGGRLWRPSTARPGQSIEVLAIEAAVPSGRTEEPNVSRVRPRSQGTGIDAEESRRFTEGQPARAASPAPRELVHNLLNSVES